MVKRVTPGDRIRWSADDHNAFARAADWVAAHEQGSKTDPRRTPREPDQIWLYNTECVDWERFEVLQLTEPVIDPAEALEAWAGSDPVFHGHTPAADHGGLVAILLEPVPGCAMGRAVVSGVVQTQITVSDAGHRYAKPSGRTLVSTDDATAPCQILWPLGETGTVYAVVRLSNGDGSDATTTTAAGSTTTTTCLLYTSPSPRDRTRTSMPSSA